MTTPADIAASAMRKLGVIDAVETPTPEDTDVCVDALISMLDASQLDPQAVIGRQELTPYTPAAGAQTITIAAAGNIVAKQPVALDPASFYRVNGVDVPLRIRTLAEYNAQASKTAQGTPQFVAYERGYATGTVYLYPAADGATQFRLWALLDVVSGYASLTSTTSLTLPNGYQNWLEWALAEEVAPEFTVPPDRLSIVMRKAANALRRIKRANLRINEMRMPAGVSSRGSFNINEG